MSKAGERLLEAAQEIDDWKAGKTKATVFVDGQFHEMTIDEFLAARARSMTLVEQIDAGGFAGAPGGGDCTVGQTKKAAPTREG